MLLHVGQHSVERGQTRSVGGDADFPEEQVIPRRFRPLRHCGQALDADGCRDSAWMRAAAVTVEILMHLEREIVPGVLNSGADDRGVVRAGPGPRPVPVTARH
jgi:hypothetical protein